MEDTNDSSWLSNLETMFSPKTIAVVGASRKPESIGRAILKNIIDFGFEGAVYPVNPKADSVSSIRCYPNLSSINDPIDLVIVVVPAKYVLSVIKEAAELGAKSAVIITAGFKEIGGEGIDMENEIIRIAKSVNMRLVGPNCMGIMASWGTKVNATFAPRSPLPGRIGFISQSGALGVVILDHALQLGLGFSKFVSLGNKADINATDMIDNLGNDPNTDVILAYLESFSDPWNFSEIATKTSRKKPILLVKSGRTKAGARAASSHTGALATVETALTAALSSAGVVRVSSVKEMFDCASAFSKLQLPKGNNVCVISNAGGPGTLATDALIGIGLNLVELQEETVNKLKNALPKEASAINPVDMIASAGPNEYKFGLETIIADEKVDSVIVIFVPPLMINTEEVASVIDDVAKSTSKPILGVIMGRRDLVSRRDRQFSYPMYFYPEDAVFALRAMTVYANWRKQPKEEVETIVTPDQNVLNIIPEAFVNGQKNLTQQQVIDLFEGYGFSFPATQIILDESNLLTAANIVDYPLVMKMASRLVEHKTDEGGVIVDIRNETELNLSWTRIQDNYDRLEIPEDQRQITIQRYYQGGVEMALGASVDPQFGPLVMIGSGGILIEVLDDVTFGRVPITRNRARSMIRTLKGFALLLGFRGDNPVDLRALEDCILKLSQMVSENRAIIELDVNPILALEIGQDPIILDARVKIQTIQQD
ncbi:MAG: acetate--CoA ligase family protein [Candidatus Kariarchaeaceae archaeon]